MATLTIRNLDEEVKRRLRLRAAQHGRSMEDEAREIMRAAVALEPEPPSKLGSRVSARFAALGGVELDIPPRQAVREPPTFDD